AHARHLVARHRKLVLPLHSHFFQHVRGRRVADQGARHDAPRRGIGERPADQVPRAFGGVAVAPGCAAQAVAEIQVSGLVARLDGVAVIERGPQVEPADEQARRALDGGEEAVAGVAGVVGLKALADLLAIVVGSGEAERADVAHHLGVVVEREQGLGVVLGEFAEDQALGDEEGGHHTSISSSDSDSSSSKVGRLGDHRHSKMPSSYKRHIGTHRNSMLKASTLGVMIAEKMASTNQAIRRVPRKWSTVRMPMRSRNSITSGVWNDRPNTTGIMMAKPSHSLSRRSGSSSSHSLNHRSASTALGITRDWQTNTPNRNRPMLIGRKTLT